MYLERVCGRRRESSRGSLDWRGQFFANEGFDLVPDFGIATNLGMASHEKIIVPGVFGAGDRVRAVVHAIIAENLRARGVRSADFRASVNEPMRLIEVHSA